MMNEQIHQAWMFASEAHAGQYLLDSKKPYLTHIGLVTIELISGLQHTEGIEDPNLGIICAILHDTIEDTKVTFEDVEHRFGKDVADGVLALSKDKSKGTKQAQMADSIERIKEQPMEVWMVKLADRITNLAPPPKRWDQQKCTKYRKEAAFILAELQDASPYLANRLQSKIDNYAQFCSDIKIS